MSNIVEVVISNNEAKTGKKGRPIVATSARQKRLAERAERAAANGGVLKRGRPATKKVEVKVQEVHVGFEGVIID